jgi:hypothetical protein
VIGWLVPSAGQKIPVQPGWYLPPQKIPLAENRFLEVGKGAENTKEKSRPCFTSCENIQIWKLALVVILGFLFSKNRLGLRFIQISKNRPVLAIFKIPMNKLVWSRARGLIHLKGAYILKSWTETLTDILLGFLRYPNSLRETLSGIMDDFVFKSQNASLKNPLYETVQNGKTNNNHSCSEGETNNKTCKVFKFHCT